MKKKRPIYEGKAKIIFEGPETDTLIQHFKDDATAFNAKKKDVIAGKGILNNYISEHDMLADIIIQNSLTKYYVFFLGVESCGIILEILNKRASLRPIKNDFGLSFIKRFLLFHAVKPCVWPDRDQIVLSQPKTRSKIVST